MGYIICYENRKPSEFGKAVGNGRIYVTVCILLVVAVMVIRYAYPQLVSTVMGVLLPGFDERTAEALSSMVTQLKQGSDAGSAVTAFCREVLQNGQIP